MEQIMYLVSGLFGIGVCVGALIVLFQYMKENNKEDEQQCNCGCCHCHNNEDEE